MKKWFVNLNPKHRKCTILGLWVATVVLFFLIGMTPGHRAISGVFVCLWLCALVLSLVFTAWAIKLAITNLASAAKKKFNVHSHSAPTVHYNKGNTATSPVIIKEVVPNAMLRENYTYPPNTTFFFVDVETATRSNDTICAIGSIIVKNDTTTSLYSLINPKTHITNTSIHGISDADVSDAPTLGEYWPTIANLIGNDFIVVGHNVAFDISVLNKDLNNYGISFAPTRKVDTMAIAKDVLYHFSTQSGDLKLDTICRKLNISLNHHNAESDIAATKQVLETLLVMGSKNITDYINLHHSSKKDNVIGNVKNLSPSRYWDDIHAGRTPVYFTNWNNTTYDADPQYDAIELEVLQFASMMDRSDCNIPRVVKQVALIKSCIDSICGKVYGKGAKKAKCYIEFYYMDVAEYIKLKGLGYKIYHAIDVENFILENKELIQQFGEEQTKVITLAAQEKERLAKEREERRAQREARKLEPKEPPKRTTRRVAQLNDDGEVIAIFEAIADAVKATGTNSKSIRDCCNGVQKHAGGFVWKFLDNEDAQ